MDGWQRVSVLGLHATIYTTPNTPSLRVSQHSLPDSRPGMVPDSGPDAVANVANVVHDTIPDIVVPDMRPDVAVDNRPGRPCASLQ